MDLPLAAFYARARGWVIVDQSIEVRWPEFLGECGATATNHSRERMRITEVSILFFIIDLLSATYAASTQWNGSVVSRSGIRRNAAFPLLAVGCTALPRLCHGEDGV
jgi:hypothetical protein